MIGWYRNAVLLLSLAFVWFILSALAAQPRISIRQPHGQLANAPTDWWIIVTIEPNPDNRLLIVTVDGQPGEYRRSDYVLEGDRAAKIWQLWFKSLPEGCYWFTAIVASSSTRALASATSGPLHVIGLDGDLCPEAMP